MPLNLRKLLMFMIDNGSTLVIHEVLAPSINLFLANDKHL